MGKFTGDVKELGIVDSNNIGIMYDIGNVCLLPGDMSMVGDVSQVDIFISSVIGTSLPIIVDSKVLRNSKDINSDTNVMVTNSNYGIFRDNNLGVIVYNSDVVIDDLMIKGYSDVRELETKFLVNNKLESTVIYIGNSIASDINLLRVLKSIKDRYANEVYIIVDGCGTPAMFYNLALLGVDAVVCSYRRDGLIMSDDINLVSRCKDIKDNMRLQVMVIGRYYGHDVRDVIKLQAIGADYVISDSLLEDCIESGLDKYLLFDSDKVFKDQVIQQKFLKYGIDIRNYAIEVIGGLSYIKVSQEFAIDLFDNFFGKYNLYVKNMSNVYSGININGSNSAYKGMVLVNSRVKDKVNRYSDIMKSVMVDTGHYSPMGFSGNVRYCLLTP